MKSLLIQDLSHNRIGSEGVGALMAALVDSSVSHLHLHNNRVDAMGGAKIGEFLAVNGSLEVLDLSLNVNLCHGN